MQTKAQFSGYEQTIISIVRRLPPERVLELIDFAKFLEFQTTREDEHKETEEDIKTEASVRSSDEKWEQILAKPEAKRVMREMAREALEDYRTGQTTDIAITEDGRLSPA